MNNLILDINPDIGFASDTYTVICRDNINLYIICQVQRNGLKNIIIFKLDTFGYVKADNSLSPNTATHFWAEISYKNYLRRPKVKLFFINLIINIIKIKYIINYILFV